MSVDGILAPSRMSVDGILAQSRMSVNGTFAPSRMSGDGTFALSRMPVDGAFAVKDAGRRRFCRQGCRLTALLPSTMSVDGTCPVKDVD